MGKQLVSLAGLGTNYTKELLNLQELESQKRASTRTLSEAKMVAELHISELEDKLEKCQHSLKLEKASALSAKQEFSRSLEQLNKENSQLKEYLSQVFAYSILCCIKGVYVVLSFPAIIYLVRRMILSSREIIIMAACTKYSIA